MASYRRRKMLSLIDDILAKLPGNGKKTLIGGVLAAVVWVFPDFPLSEDGLSKLIEYSGYIYLTLGALHKWVKAKVYKQ